MRWPPPPKAMMNRAEFSEWSGIAYNTVRAHERAGIVTPLDFNDRPYFTEDHLVAIIKHGAERGRVRRQNRLA